MWRIICVMATLVVLVIAEEPPGSSRGRELFQKRCTGCHSLDKTKVGPALRGVYGRRAAADPHFPYSDALKKAQFSWNEATLDKWLADPDAVAPENDMSFRLDNTADRAAIIEYLKQLPAKREDSR